MKKITILFAIVIINNCCIAQSAIYKHYLHRDGIKASYIKNYTVGNLKVNVTMLEADSPQTFLQLARELRTLPRHNESKKANNSKSTNIKQHLLLKRTIKNISKNDTLDPTMVRQLFNMLQIESIEVTKVEAENGATEQHDLTILRTIPLSGDNGQYIIYRSSNNLTFLVFHAPDDQYADKLCETIMQQYINNLTSTDKK